MHCLFLFLQSFDGVKLCLPAKMPRDVTHFTSANPETEDSVAVSLHFKAKRKGSDLGVIQHYNILFNRVFRALKFSMHNRNFYDPMGAHHIKQHNLQVWPGYITAVDEYEGGLLLNLDIGHRVLRTETVKDFLTGLARRSTTNFKADAEKALLGTSILTRYNNR